MWTFPCVAYGLSIAVSAVTGLTGGRESDLVWLGYTAMGFPALGGIHHLENIALPWVLLIVPIGHIGAGIFLGWLWLRAQSTWRVTLAHGALNNWGRYAYIRGSRPGV